MKSYVAIGALLVLVSCSTAVAHADTVPWLAGDFSLSCAGVCGGFATGQNYAYAYSSYDPFYPTALFEFAPPPNLPYSQCCLDPSCDIVETTWEGSASGGSVGFGEVTQDPTLTFSGWMSGGEITGRIVDTAGSHDWQFDFAFSGIWSNGWRSEGVADVYVGTNAFCVGCDGAVGSLEMTTFTTPEPGTLLTLGSGILGLTGLARKRLLG